MDLSHGFLSHIKSEERRMTAFYFLPLAWFVRVCNMCQSVDTKSLFLGLICAACKDKRGVFS